MSTAAFLCSCAPPDGGKAVASEIAKPITISTALAEVRTVSSFLRETGSFLADESSEVAPAVAGRVSSTPVDIGDFVQSGQVICELEHVDAKLRLDQARATLEQARFALRQARSRVGLASSAKFDPESVPEVAAARSNWEAAASSAKLAAADAKRYENLVRSGDVSQSNWEKFNTQKETAEAAARAAHKRYEAEINSARQNYGGVEGADAAVTAAEAQVAQAEKGLADTFVRAPFDGYVTARPVAAGQWVGSNNNVATVVRISTMKLRLQVSEERAAQVKAGMLVTARVAAFPDRDFNGKITAVVPSVDSASRSFTAEARFENAAGDLRPGMFATGRVQLAGVEKAVFVPSNAVFYDQTTDAHHVYVLANNKAQLTVVLKGDPEGNRVRIVSGLNGTETLATGDLSAVYNGASVVPHS